MLTKWNLPMLTKWNLPMLTKWNLQGTVLLKHLRKM